MFTEKLDGDVSELDPRDYSQNFTFGSEQPHTQTPLNTFGDIKIVSGCDPKGKAFDYFSKYCSPKSVFPNCILTEKAFKKHGLLDTNPGKKTFAKGLQRVKHSIGKKCKAIYEGIRHGSKWGCVKLVGGKTPVKVEE